MAPVLCKNIKGLVFLEFMLHLLTVNNTAPKIQFWSQARDILINVKWKGSTSVFVAAVGFLMALRVAVFNCGDQNTTMPARENKHPQTNMPSFVKALLKQNEDICLKFLQHFILKADYFSVFSEPSGLTLCDGRLGMGGLPKEWGE